MLRLKYKAYNEDYVKLSCRYVTNEFNIDFDVCLGIIIMLIIYFYVYF